MNLLPRSLARRIALALTLSLLLHAVILWLPHVRLPDNAIKLPPLTARLEPLPVHAAQIAAKQPNQTTSIGSNEVAAPALPEADKEQADTNAVDEPAKHHWPNHVQLAFDVYNHANGFKSGEVHQQLDISRSRYTLKSVRQGAGLGGMFDRDQLVQVSRGRVNAEQGMQPETFREEQFSNGSKKIRQATFDRAAQELHFSDGGKAVLPADAQDVLSFLYQLSLLSLSKREFFPIAVGDATQLAKYQIEIGVTENINTAMGTLRALHLRKMHGDSEAYFEIWLALEYRLLPIKFQQIDASGNISDQMVISDIRATDQ